MQSNIEEIKFIHTVILASIFPFMVAIVAPLTFYFGNHAEYSIGISQLLPFVFFIFAIFSFVLFAIIYFAKRTRNRFIILGLLIGTSISIWLQSQIFTWDFGPLDGRGIDWGKWKTHSFAEMCVWLILIIVTIRVAYKSIKITTALAKGVFFLGVLSLFSSIITSDYEIKQFADRHTSTAFSFHPENNKILIVLDTFQSDVFHEIAERWPEEVEFLEGFTFYPNTLGGYPTTQVSIPLMLTGNFYKNEIPVKEWIKSNNKQGNIPDTFSNSGYGVDLVSMVTSTLDGINTPKLPISFIADNNSLSKLGSIVMVIDGGVFRSLPTMFKPKYYDNGNWFLTNMVYDKSVPPGEHGADLRFVQAFEQNITIESESKGEFKYYHLRGAHWPLQISEDYEYIPDMPGDRESYVRQSRGVISLLRRLLDALKEKGIYASSEIIVVGDHGSNVFPPNDIKGTESEMIKFRNSAISVLASSRPLFLYKQSDKTDPLSYSNSAMHLAYIACIFSDKIKYLGCKYDKNILQNNQNLVRSFFYYDWSMEYHDWSQEYMPPMIEYSVKGDVREISSWSTTDIEYSRGEKRVIPKVATYKLDDLISFSANGTSKLFTKTGWSGQEPEYRWTDATQAAFNLHVQEYNRKDLLLSVNASPYLGGGLAHQKVRVIVNGEQVMTWKMKDREWYEARIPAKIVNDGKLDVVFHISDPTAPCEVGDSKDCRKLGMAVRQIVIDELSHAKSSLFSSYKLPAKIIFRLDGNGSKVLTKGWSGQEAEHRWTDATQAAFNLHVQEYNRKDLLLSVNASPYLGGGLSHQKVRVIVNGEQVATWKMKDRKWYEARIPAEIVNDGKLEVVFHISDPTAPCEVSNSKDCRKLGIAARELIIDYAKNMVKK